MYTKTCADIKHFYAIVEQIVRKVLRIADPVEMPGLWKNFYRLYCRPDRIQIFAGIWLLCRFIQKSIVKNKEPGYFQDAAKCSALKDCTN